MVIHIPKPTVIEAAGQPPKSIEEFIGRVNSDTSTVSIARMKSPSGWVEPGQTPEFDEYTVVLRGKCRKNWYTGTSSGRPIRLQTDWPSGSAGFRGTTFATEADQPARTKEGDSMTRPVDPVLVRKLADCIERLPNHVNDPRRMPFVHETLRSAFERFRFDRKAMALGLELQGDLRKAEQYRQPVQSIPLFDDDKRALEDGFEHDEAGVFELFEYVAAEIGEWLKDCRHARDAERFRDYLKFVYGEAVLMAAEGVEVRPGVYKLDLDTWKAEAAKPLCNYLRELADEMATKSPKRTSKWTMLLEVSDELKDKSDAEIVAAYNRRFGNSTRWPKRATPRNLQNARSYRKRKKSKSNHESDSGDGAE